MLLALLAAGALLLGGCGRAEDPAVSKLNVLKGSGNVISEERAVRGIKRVELTTFGELTILLGEKEALRVEGEDNLLPHLETNVAGGVLTIRFKPGVNINPTRPLLYTLTVVSLEGIANRSLGSISAPNFKGDSFSLNISSGGGIHLAGLDVQRLDVTISSLGSLEIGGGQVDRQTINLSSGGSYRAGNLRSRAANATLSGLGNATLWVTEQLDATLNSGGAVEYYGSPKVTAKETSLGRVKKLGDR
jgi:hypothetical protein